jgi:hypothetical protein
MTLFSLPDPPLAQTLWDRFSQGLSDEFRHRQLTLAHVLLGAAVLLGVIIAASAISSVLKSRDPYRIVNSPLRLFWELCRAHKLRWRECWWLWRLARAERLRDPARLFLEPERFDPAQLGPALARRQRELTSIRNRLFADVVRKTPVEPEAGSPPPRTNTNVPIPASGEAAATPLLPPSGVPTLDLPPWNVSGKL